MSYPTTQCDVPYDAAELYVPISRSSAGAFSGCLSPEDPAARAILRVGWFVPTHRGVLQAV